MESVQEEDKDFEDAFQKIKFDSMNMKGRQTMAPEFSRRSTFIPVEPPKQPEIQDNIVELLKEDEFGERFGLPETWARHMQKRTKQDNC